MELFEILATLVVIVFAMVITAIALFVDREDLKQTSQDFRGRFRATAPFIAILAFVLLFNAQFRILFHEVSWSIGFRVTQHIFRFEGHTIVLIQSVFGDQFAWFFSFMYVFGYVFLLVFPLIAYFVLDRLDTFKSLTLAYAANYVIGLFFYLIIVAYGPRNTPVFIEAVQYLYWDYPQFQLLTSEINMLTNVFPSLHTSLSATVMLFAWRTREYYPLWFYLAMFFGMSIIISTMYLAIHWLVDVLGGLVLAMFCYWIGVKAVEQQWISRLFLRRGGWQRVQSVFRN